VFTFDYCHTILQDVAEVAGIYKRWVFEENVLDFKLCVTTAVSIRIKVVKN
jgi:hypothetical protein